MSQHGPGAGAWGVLLAGGDGTRLQSLPTRIEGNARPKQSRRILGDQSLLILSIEPPWLEWILRVEMPIERQNTRIEPPRLVR